MASPPTTRTCARHFLAEHLEQLAMALAEGVDVTGYLYWSLMDNFEWDLGTAPHFGLRGGRRDERATPHPAGGRAARPDLTR